MQKKLTLEDIARLRENYKNDSVLQGLLSALEPDVKAGKEIIWHNPPIDPIPPRPWTCDDDLLYDANGQSIFTVHGARSAAYLGHFIVDRVNAGETNSGTIERLMERIRTINDEQVITQAHSILDEMGVPKAERAECNRPECNSLLIHRLHSLRSNGLTFDKWWSNTSNQNFFKREAITVDRLREVASEAWSAAKTSGFITPVGTFADFKGITNALRAMMRSDRRLGKVIIGDDNHFHCEFCDARAFKSSEVQHKTECVNTLMRDAVDTANRLGL